MEARTRHRDLGLWFLPLCGGLCVIAGCGGSDAGRSDGPTGPGGDEEPALADGPTGDGSSDGDAGAGNCPGGDGAQELTPVSTVFPGVRTLCGTAFFPADTATGRQIRFKLLRPGMGQETIDVGQTDGVDRVHYQVAVDPDTYLIGFEVDQVADMALGAGDYRGFYDGTLIAPKILEGDATPVDLTTADRTDVDFGLGTF